MTNLRQPPARPVRMRGRDHALDEWTAHGSTLYYYDVGVSIFAGARLTPLPSSCMTKASKGEANLLINVIPATVSTCWYPGGFEECKQ